MPLGTFLNGDSPVRLRGLLWLSLSDVGQVGTRTSTSDSGGGATEVWAYGTDVPCRVDPVTSDEGVVGGRLDDRSTHVITTPPGTTITSSSRFRVTGGGTYEVTAVRTSTAEQVTFFEAVEVS